ncbi:hypothetical protein GJ496_003863 [Pomphorhynchus laevis]|nr:hypothetical protein GJ496_003863 [Pomphorhynchus laevis]
MMTQRDKIKYRNMFDDLERNIFAALIERKFRDTNLGQKNHYYSMGIKEIQLNYNKKRFHNKTLPLYQIQYRFVSFAEKRKVV